MSSIILASGSPRRKELLQLAGFDFEVCIYEVDETLNPDLDLGGSMEEVALKKATIVKNKYPDAIVLGADTAVVIDGEVLGKPKDDKDAYDMLSKLSGKVHQVITSTAILHGDKSRVWHCISNVTFYSLSDQDIKEYIDYGEYKDKAGSYAIQGRGATLVKHIDGDYYAIVGLPIAKVTRYLKQVQSR